MELAGVIIAGLALILAAYSTFRVRKFEKNQNELTELQLKQEKEKLAQSNKAKCDASIVRTGKTDWILKIFNKGQGNAKNIHFEFTSVEKVDILCSGSSPTFPIIELKPQTSVDFHLLIHMGLSESSWPYKIDWENEDSTNGTDSGVLSLPLQ